MKFIHRTNLLSLQQRKQVCLRESTVITISLFRKILLIRLWRMILCALKEVDSQPWVLTTNRISTTISTIFSHKLFLNTIQSQGQLPKVELQMTTMNHLISHVSDLHHFVHTFMTYSCASSGQLDGFFITCSAVAFATRSVICSLFHHTCSRSISKRENNRMIRRQWMPWFIFWKTRQDPSTILKPSGSIHN